MRLLIGLGGNVGDVPVAFAEACGQLAAEVKVLRRSQLYRSEPVGPVQPRYWNMVVLVGVDRPLLSVLELCQAVEADAGRDRRGEERWGPRPLDLDLLMTPDVVRRDLRLELPHPRFHERAFALVPAAELCPDWVHPVVGKSLLELAQAAVAEIPQALEVVGALEI